MAEDWLALQKQITRDLKNDGMEFTFTRQNRSMFDPVAGSFRPDAKPETFKAYGIFKSLGSSTIYSSNYSKAWLAGLTVERNDKMALIDCTTYAPELEDFTELHDGKYLVKAVSPVEPGGVALIRYILLRKG